MSKGGFADNTKELQQRDNGNLFLVKKKGRTYRTEFYTIDTALKFVAEGKWVELEPICGAKRPTKGAKE